ncbi:hypothetical protein [Anaeroarcus burkinensis]|uniref:hypothetical protein n=1 Tax=Anaeroarcus burkinensis TaxID=82376 RepID=UPI000429FB19|nr:hypothetical protein [Anaeroarcus burkinensis]
MSDTFNRIVFEHMDWGISPEMESAAKNIANFLHDHPDKIELAREGMRALVDIRKRNADWVSHFQNWKNVVCKMKRINVNAPDYKAFFQLIKNCFDVCGTLKDFEKMCGTVPEKYVEVAYETRYISRHPQLRDNGCKVIIDGNEVVYQPECTVDRDGDADIRCVSVDIAAWDGRFSDFIEIKISPEGFQTKNINYFRLLRQRLVEKDLRHFIRLYTWGQKDLLKERLALLGVGEDEFLLLVGKEVKEVAPVEELAVGL